MDDKQSPKRSERSDVRRVLRFLGRPRIVMGLLLLIAIPIFIHLANRAVQENAEAIRQTFGQ
jgi:hypothetical protein